MLVLELVLVVVLELELVVLVLVVVVVGQGYCTGNASAHPAAQLARIFAAKQKLSEPCGQFSSGTP